MERRSEVDIKSIFLSNDRKKIILSLENNKIEILDIDTFLTFKELDLNHNNLNKIILTSDNKYLIISDLKEEIWIFDLIQNKNISKIIWKGSKINSIEEIARKNKLIIISEDKIIYIFDFSGNLLNQMKGHQAGLTSIAVSPDDKFIISGSEDYDLRVWDIDRAKLLKTIEEHEFPINNIQISSKGNFFFSASKEKIIIWDFKRFKILRSIEQFTPPLNYILISPDEKYLIGACKNKIICINLQNYRITAIHEVKLEIFFMDVNYNGKILLIGIDKKIIIKYVLSNWINKFKVELKETPEYVKIPFQAYRGKPPFVFISYSHRDKHIVYPEMLTIHNKNYNIWYDEGIPPTSEWPEEIENAINKCSIFLVFITPNSVESKSVRNEINYALKIKKKLLIIYLEPTELKHGLALRLNSLQAILRYDMDQELYYEKLFDSLNIIFKY